MDVANGSGLGKIAAMPPDERHPMAARVKKMSDANWLRVFSLPVFLIGAGFFAFVTVGPVYQMLASRGWQETPCVVESSQVIDYPGDESSTYSIEVVYNYYWNSRKYTSHRYNFVFGSWSGYYAKEAVVARYPSGKETICFVNPKAPQEAVINRAWQPEMGMGGIGLVFALAGGLVFAFAGQIARPKVTTEGHAGGAIEAPKSIAPYPEITPRRKSFRYLAGALFFNGFIGFIAYFLFFVEDPGKVELGPKIIIGLLLVAGVLFLIEAFTRLFALLKPPTAPAKAGSRKRRK